MYDYEAPKLAHQPHFTLLATVTLGLGFSTFIIPTDL